MTKLTRIPGRDAGPVTVNHRPDHAVILTRQAGPATPHRRTPGASAIRALLAGFLLATAAACHRPAPSPAPLFELETSTGIDFSNNLVNKPDFNIVNYRNFYNGGGVATGDINNDGLPDIFFTSNMGDNKLYLNKGNWQFEDISEKAGFARGKKQWSTGVVMADVNGDGWLDIYVCNAGNMNNPALRRNQLFINDHHNHFIDSAGAYGLADSGYTTQASFFDYDGDGDLDCFLINNSPMVNTLDYVNQREMKDIDLSSTGNSQRGGDHLFRNDNGHFTEVTREAGIHGSPISLGLGVTVGDVDGDGWPDVYVSNDFFERDYLYINQRNGTFKDELQDRMQHISLASMGADIGDINNDGYPDIFTTDMLPDDDYRLKTTFAFETEDVYRLKQKAGFYHQFFQNALQLNNGNGKFLEIADYAGVNATDWSWGGLLFDMDNDGYNDIFVSNGIAQDLINQDFLDFFANNMAREMQATGKKPDLNALLEKIPSHPLVNKVYHNNGALSFSDSAGGWGFSQPSFSTGAAYADLDGDGDLDLVVNNVNQRAFVYRNRSREQNHHHYLAVLLKGKTRNLFAIGSTIRLYRGDTVYYREVMPARGFQSSVDYRQLIGLGCSTHADSLVIQWPDRSRTHIDHPGIDRLLRIDEDNPRSAAPATAPTAGSARTGPATAAGPVPATSAIPGPATPLLTQAPSGFDKHAEDDYIDFYTEHNLPKLLSREGPRAAVGDLNGDGLDDVYIGGTQGHPGQVYLQTPDGRFVKKPEPGFGPFSDFEDGAVLLFDADNDGDLDLFVGPGGNDAAPESRQMQLRLYRNDGKGNFSIDVDAFPNTIHGVNTGAAVAGDFNHDGHPDLFVGGRSIPHEYGAAPSSFLFLNDGHGHFSDVAPTRNPDIAHVGMVTAAVYDRVTGDSSKQLVLAGDWMGPHVFSWKNDRFEAVPTNLDGLHGWWTAIAAADLDGDGLPDLILGNLGENFYLHPDKARPVKLWVGDFDGNGITDKILTRTIDGRDMPVFLKKDLEMQLPSLKKQHLNYADYAGKSIQELLGTPALAEARVDTLDYAPSIVALNKGGGRFEVRPLPPMVQLSSVNAIQCIDVDGDGHADLVLGGNDYGFLPMFGRLDASFGHLLLGDGKGGFSWTGPARSGLDITGQVRDIARLRTKNRACLLFLRNDDFPVLYRLPYVSLHKK
ncbi:MAG TPA: VCBS repeat-containing protein [Puia sp.]|nr:VCBS repeat-containing protein [Puia sp.]